MLTDKRRWLVYCQDYRNRKLIVQRRKMNGITIFFANEKKKNELVYFECIYSHCT